MLDITVLGGLTLTIDYDSDGSEWYVTWIGNRKVRAGEKLAWLYKRLHDSGDEALIDEAMHEYFYA